ncbi:MAG: hypothetical protein M3442_17710, partial [Chloroflexota bacterium]|nr:hypothetical protein [Chloroflexota bacterium]
MADRFQRMPRLQARPAVEPAAPAPVAKRRVQLGWGSDARRESWWAAGVAIVAILATLCAVLIVSRRGAADQAAGPAGTGRAVPAAPSTDAPAGRTAQETPADAPPVVTDGAAGAAAVTPAVPEAAKARAVDLLGAAAAERQLGRLTQARDLAQQALAEWPDYPDAAQFMGDLATQAQAVAQAAQVQAERRAQEPAVPRPGTPTAPSPVPGATAETPRPVPAAGAPTAALAGARAAPLVYGFQGELFHTPTRPQALAAIKAAGFGWAKQQARWEDYEVQQAECARDAANCVQQTINGRPKYFRKNRLEWLDAIVEDASAAGVYLLLSVVRAPDFHAAPGGHTPADPETLGDFLQFLAGRYRGKVKAIEPWNEQNLSWEWGGARLWPNALVA